MFNDFNLKDNEILKIIEDYKPLIIKNSKINFKFDEDLAQEIKLFIWKKLSKNKKIKKIFKKWNILKNFWILMGEKSKGGFPYGFNK